MSVAAGQPLSLEPEQAAAAIKHFALVDSSDDEFELSEGAGGGLGGGPANGGNRFDSSKMDWSRLLDESSDATPSPPLRPKPTLASQLGALTGAPQPATDASAAAAPTAHVSSFRKLALMDSDGSVEGAASEATPPPARRVRSRPTATAARATPPGGESESHRGAPASLIPALLPDAAAAASPIPPPSQHETRKESAPKARTSAASDFKAAPTPPDPAVPQRPPAAAAAAVAVSASAGPTPPHDSPPAAPAKTRPAPQRPAALKAAKAPPTTAPATEEAPFSPGVVYTTVPQWTKGMKKRNGVYVTSKTVANPTALYDRGMKGLQRAAERRDALRAKLEAEERSAMTFRPTISPRAHAIARGGRPGNEDGGETEMAQQLRHRLQLLELPEEATAAACRHSPRLSNASMRMVRECRERSGTATPAGDRLYQDHFYRQQALEAAQEPPPPPSLVRSQRDIAAHIATLYDFEAHRQCALSSARAAPLALSPRAPAPLHVDPEDVVERLTRHPAPSPRRVAQSLLQREECTFQPQANANAASLVRDARLRGVVRWVSYLGGSTAALPMTALLDYTGPAQGEAQGLAALLSLRDPARAAWTVEEVAAELEQSGNALLAQLWRRRPPLDDAATVSSDLTFHPTLNSTSAAMVQGMEAEVRCGPTHERLFLAAKSRQLSQRQQELEVEQAALEAQQQLQARKERQQAEWRAKERRRLEEHHAEKARQTQVDAVLVQQPPLLITVAPEPLAALQAGHIEQRPSRQLKSQPSVSPDRTASTRRQRSLSPLRATRAASSYAASLPKAEETVPRVSVPVPPMEALALSIPAAANPAAEATHLPTTTTTVRADVSALPSRRDSRDLSSAAETLRQLLGNTTRSPPAPSRSPTVATALSDTAPQPTATAAPIASRDINRPPTGKSQSRSVDVVLECATLRDVSTVAQGERGDLERSQKRQLRELGRLLYNRHKVRVDDR